MREYELLFKAYTLRKIDEEENLHFLAWLITKAQGTKKDGTLIYRTFKSFFNKENKERRALQIFSSKKKVEKRTEKMTKEEKYMEYIRNKKKQKHV